MNQKSPIVEDLSQISRSIIKIQDGQLHTNLAVGNFGFITCRRKQTVNQIPQDTPGFFMVFEGQKILKDKKEIHRIQAGNLIGVPGESIFSVENLPDPNSNTYTALFISLTEEIIQKILLLYGDELPEIQKAERYADLQIDDEISEAVLHFLAFLENWGVSASNARITHKVIEIVLIILARCPNFIPNIYLRKSWSAKVRQLVSENLAYDWNMEEISRQLFLSQSSLYRHLKAEGSGYREILEKQRMLKALTLIQTANKQITDVALECGYGSLSRFTERFSERFGISPVKLRKTLTFSGQK